MLTAQVGVKITFKVAKVARMKDGKSGFSWCTKLGGKIIALGWKEGTRADALFEAQCAGEDYGWIDE